MELDCIRLVNRLTVILSLHLALLEIPDENDVRFGVLSWSGSRHKRNSRFGCFGLHTQVLYYLCTSSNGP